jgi:hypothetical protein
LAGRHEALRDHTGGEGAERADRRFSSSLSNWDTGNIIVASNFANQEAKKVLSFLQKAN